MTLRPRRLLVVLPLLSVLAGGAAPCHEHDVLRTSCCCPKKAAPEGVTLSRAMCCSVDHGTKTVPAPAKVAPDETARPIAPALLAWSPPRPPAASPVRAPRARARAPDPPSLFAQKTAFLR